MPADGSMQDLNLDQMPQHAEEAANFLRKLANPNRLMVLCALINGEMSVGELNSRIPLSQSALSQHLAALRKAGIVATRREAQTIFYRLNGSDAIAVIGVLQQIFCPD